MWKNRAETDRLIRSRERFCPETGNDIEAKFPTISLVGNFASMFVFFGDPAGARTQDPNIKSVVLYLLSY